MYAVDYGMNWWSGLSANQYCQNSPSWPWWSCKCCLTIARFNWTLCLACFLASIDHTQAHTQNVLGMQFLPRSLHLSPPISPKQPCQSHSPLLRTLKPVQHAQPHPLLCLLAPPLHIPRNLQWLCRYHLNPFSFWKSSKDCYTAACQQPTEICICDSSLPCVDVWRPDPRTPPLMSGISCENAFSPNI